MVLGVVEGIGLEEKGGCLVRSVHLASLVRSSWQELGVEDSGNGRGGREDA